jgi:acyl-CoA reductase-like NAD-dependent aldehyde dehydrogenase
MSIDWHKRAAAFRPAIRDFINGRYLNAASGELTKQNPRDGAPLYALDNHGVGNLEDGVAGAQRASADGRWSNLASSKRKEVLLRLADLMEKHREELALLECLDVGKPIRDALNVDVPMAIATIRANAEFADKVYTRVYNADPRNFSFQLKRPIGVVGAIVGWNFPLVLATQKAGPALAAGNTIILKPSELTSLSASRLAELAAEAGVPDSVFNVVHGGRALGAALSRHDHVDLLSFTGSSQTGKQMLIAAGQSNMKRLVLECGGKAPNIVFEDCPDLDAAAEAIVARAFWNQGQVCTASSRLLVHENIAARLVKSIAIKTEALTPADPLLMATRFGALVSRAHLDKVSAYVAAGSEEGARLIYQGGPAAPVEGGFYASPSIFTDVSPRSTIAQQEIFGPVLSVLTFRDDMHAIELANNTIYGLSAIVWTADLARAQRMALGLRAGWVSINATARPSGGPGTAMMGKGGHKQSGLALEGGVDGLEALMTNTAVQFFI